MSTRAIGVGVVLICAFLVSGALGTVSAQSGLLPSEALGKALFFDDSLSVNGNQSCAACHGPQAGWTGPDSAINAHGAVYEGSIAGAFGDRKPPSSAYATQSPIFHMDKKGLFVGGNFWDGRATGERLGNPAADQAQGPFLNPMEQALSDAACVVYRACTGGYGTLMTQVWGDATCAISWPGDVEATCANPSGFLALSPEDRGRADAAYDAIALSIADYEASFESNAFTSQFDYWRMGQANLTKLEQRGFSIFQGKGRCAKCHVSTGQQPLFTDYTFDNLGLPKNPENPVYGRMPDYVDQGLGGYLASRPDYAPYAEGEMGKHKVPTVRNVGLGLETGITKAYGHNGYFKSLEGIVHFYNTRDVLPTCSGAYTDGQALAAGCWPAPEVAENVNDAELGNLGLSAAEEAALVAFLKTLSDGYVAPMGAASLLEGGAVYLPAVSGE